MALPFGADGASAKLEAALGFNYLRFQPDPTTYTYLSLQSQTFFDIQPDLRINGAQRTASRPATFHMVYKFVIKNSGKTCFPSIVDMMFSNTSMYETQASAIHAIVCFRSGGAAVGDGKRGVWHVTGLRGWQHPDSSHLHRKC